MQHQIEIFQILNTLNSIEPNGKYIVLYGPPKCGKTCLAHYMLHPQHLQASFDEERKLHFLKYIGKQQIPQLIHIRNNIIQFNSTENDHFIRRFMQAANIAKHGLLVLTDDEVEQVDTLPDRLSSFLQILGITDSGNSSISIVITKVQEKDRIQQFASFLEGQIKQQQESLVQNILKDIVKKQRIYTFEVNANAEQGKAMYKKILMDNEFSIGKYSKCLRQPKQLQSLCQLFNDCISQFQQNKPLPTFPDSLLQSVSQDSELCRQEITKIFNLIKNKKSLLERFQDLQNGDLTKDKGKFNVLEALLNVIFNKRAIAFWQTFIDMDLYEFFISFLKEESRICSPSNLKKNYHLFLFSKEKQQPIEIQFEKEKRRVQNQFKSMSDSQLLNATPNCFKLGFLLGLYEKYIQEYQSNIDHLIIPSEKKKQAKQIVREIAKIFRMHKMSGRSMLFEASIYNFFSVKRHFNLLKMEMEFRQRKNLNDNEKNILEYIYKVACQTVRESLKAQIVSFLQEANQLKLKEKIIKEDKEQQQNQRTKKYEKNLQSLKILKIRRKQINYYFQKNPLIQEILNNRLNIMKECYNYQKNQKKSMLQSQKLDWIVSCSLSIQEQKSQTKDSNQ